MYLRLNQGERVSFLAYYQYKLDSVVGSGVYIYLPTPLLGQDMTQAQMLSRV